MSCGIITIGSEAVECEDLAIGGTRARLILINYVDILRMYVSDIGVILSIELRPGAVGYEFLGFRNDVKKSDEVIENDITRFKHNVSFVVYDVSQVQKNNVVNLAKGRFVAIAENKGKDENSLEVLGRECGLKVVGGQIRNAYENGGFFVINLSTPDNGVELETNLPQNLGATYQGGQDIIDVVLGNTPVTTEGFDYVLDLILP